MIPDFVSRIVRCKDDDHERIDSHFVFSPRTRAQAIAGIEDRYWDTMESFTTVFELWPQPTPSGGELAAAYNATAISSGAMWLAFAEYCSVTEDKTKPCSRYVDVPPAGAFGPPWNLTRSIERESDEVEFLLFKRSKTDMQTALDWGAADVMVLSSRLHPVADAAYAEAMLRNLATEASSSSSARNVIHIVTDGISSTEFRNDTNLRRLATAMRPFLAGDLSAQRGQWHLVDLLEKAPSGKKGGGGGRAPWTTTPPTMFTLSSQPVRVQLHVSRVVSDAFYVIPDDSGERRFETSMILFFIGTFILGIAVFVWKRKVERRQREQYEYEMAAAASAASYAHMEDNARHTAYDWQQQQQRQRRAEL
ncbi:hypothetical protein PINS_up013884 [Pythium insidiosum]|nr:hypothetical protein PINS_up013884 [Pythium insidiosum]